MVYVDEIREFPYRQIKPAARKFGTLWCHCIADTKEELHSFAKKLGLGIESFQDHDRLWHYDLIPSKRIKAVQLGAVQVTSEKLVASKYITLEDIMN